MKTWRGRRPAVAAPRAIVSVAFAVDDFDAIDRAAEALGVATSAFIRAAALEKAGLLGRDRAPAHPEEHE